ncbi:sensor histidine kinase [Sphingomicrobium arenosum]|uniref:sensor histidine kinase n=1 Tax=Sphingomicrobium arenosum TaxID=2233861 RepID=UPI002240F402|nr:ATP-binding protein [Sphingomicrobium arenosum]
MTRPRLTLSGQVALLVAVAILLAQAFNLAIALQRRHAQLLDDAIVPGAQRLALLAAEPLLLDRVERIGERRGTRGLRPPRGALGPRRNRPLGRIRAEVGLADPLATNSHPVAVADAIIADAFADAGVPLRDAGAGLLDNPRLPRPGEEARQRLLLAAQLQDGRWISLAVPGPRPLRPLIGAMIFQSLLIALAVLLPTLLLLRRVGGSLRAVTGAAQRFDGRAAGPPLPETGPSDIVALAAALNDMQARIAAMLSEKDVMLGAIGHDLRTPLTALRIEVEGVEDEERRAALIEQIERLHEQFEAVLDLARANRAPAPDAMVDDAALFDRLAASYAGQPLTVDPPVSAIFPGDAASVERALANLIDNGLRHGTAVHLSLAPYPGEVVIMVCDDGPGIPAELRARLLRPFERAEQSRNRATGGHGLGLAIVAAIMRRHGGRLDLGDRPDGKAGLCARLHFPRAPLV